VVGRICETSRPRFKLAGSERGGSYGESTTEVTGAGRCESRDTETGVGLSGRP